MPAGVLLYEKHFFGSVHTEVKGRIAMTSNMTAWRKTVRLLPWIVVSVGLAGILKGLLGGLSSDDSSASFWAGILTCYIGAMWLYNRNP